MNLIKQNVDHFDGECKRVGIFKFLESKWNSPMCTEETLNGEAKLNFK